MEKAEIQVIREFVAESRVKLSQLNREMVELEQRPEDAALLTSVFRTIHTLKGTCGFLGYHVIAQVTYHVENILGQLRNGQRKLTPQLVSLILETADAIKTELTSIDATLTESGASYTELLKRQEAAATATARPADEPAE